jgi:alanyl-tRNA synthetase
MTERLYHTDSHLTEFTARVVSVNSLDENRFAVVLDRTAFYPTGGGQPFDTGVINDARVVDCTSNADDEIQHIIEGEAPVTMAEVESRVDWPRRFDHLQQHTAQHILSQAFIKLFDAETHSFRMMDEYSEIDISLDSPSDARIKEVVALANEIVWQNRPVRVHFATAEEAAQRGLNLRKKSKRAGKLRIIEIEDYDANACGGTHAARTGEVGVIVVRAWERAKGMTRVEFLAGGRALRDYARANKAARDAAMMLGTPRDEAPQAVARLMEENKNLLRRTHALEEIALRIEAQELLAETKSNDKNVRIVARVFEERDIESLKRLAHFIADSTQCIALLGSIENKTARLIFARSTDTNYDMNNLMREVCAQIGGRGGGRKDFAQGGGQARDIHHLGEIIESAKRHIQD